MTTQRTALALLERGRTDDIDRGRRTLDYLCLAQLYLDEVRPHERLTVDDLAADPSGHWGVCPSMNSVLAVLRPLKALERDGHLSVVHGAGHAGASVRADRYLDGSLGLVDPMYRPSRRGTNALARGFRDGDRFGHEVTPLLPGVDYMGGHLGGALAYAQGVVLDRPDHISVPIIGDGECETGATAGAWLAAASLRATGEHGHVVPVVLLNGQRMGGVSALARLTGEALAAYLGSQGWDPLWASGHADLADLLATAIERSRPLGGGIASCVVLDMDKGYGAPVQDGEGRPLMGTPRVHKTPLSSPASDDDEFRLLAEWVRRYRPEELFDDSDVPRIASSPSHRVRARTRTVSGTSPIPTAGGFGDAVVRAMSTIEDGGRVFSPDELNSNGVPARLLSRVVGEVLNEEVCHLWLQGYVMSGRRGLAIEYEAFASVAVPWLRQFAKTLALCRQADRWSTTPALVYLLTSLGWRNSYTHQDPGAVLGLLEHAPCPVRVLSPADPRRLQAVLTRCLASSDEIAVVTADKYSTTCYPMDSLDAELELGIAVWPSRTDPGVPDVTLLVAGDVAAASATVACDDLRREMPGVRIQWVCLLDLGALDSMTAGTLDVEEYFPGRGPVIVVAPYFATTLKARLFDLPSLAARCDVVGFRDLGRHLKGEALLEECGMSSDRLFHRMRLAVSGTVPGEVPDRREVGLQ